MSMSVRKLAIRRYSTWYVGECASTSWAGSRAPSTLTVYFVFLSWRRCLVIRAVFDESFALKVEKVHSSTQESNDALVAPLLQANNGAALGDASDAEEQDIVSDSAYFSQETMEALGGDSRLLSAPPIVNRLIASCIRVRTVADVLPPLLYTVVTNGKAASLAFVAINLLFITAWLPFWFLSFAITEWGIYLLAVATVFFVGRAIIRMIAFPGASRRVTADMETEFARYSVRMIISATNSLIEAASLVAPGAESTDHAQQNATRRTNHLPTLWRHATSYRDRVLGVYLEVLLHLYRQSPSPSHATEPDLCKFGNNRLSGDIGDLSGLTPQALTDGRALLDRLSTALRLLDDMENSARSVLEGSAPLSSLSDESRVIGKNLMGCLVELRDFVTCLKPPAAEVQQDSEEDDDPAETIRRRIDEQSAGSALDAVKTGLSSILPMLDPPPHTLIFGFDVQRGCLLSRYRGARQFWVRRPAGGMIDVLHFPARGHHGVNAVPNPKAVLYCNPNAGLVEFAAGMSLSGGNVTASSASSNNNNAHESWVDLYTDLGIDCYIFNYAGYGRSYGTTLCASGRKADEVYRPGIFARMSRIFRSCFLSFQPTSDTLRADGVAVGQYLLNDIGIQQLVIHGESIGGVAASGAGRFLSQLPSTGNRLRLLVCDRTFCNLEALAQRLVGGWSGYAIRALAPFWNTDVVGPYLAATCPKVVASDAADMLIADAASLKSCVALWKEMYRGVATTKEIGWITEEPLQYRMADWENVCVNDSRYVAAHTLIRAQPPVWPSDKHISVEEAFHFAACCKRIGKLAKEAARSAGMETDVDGEGISTLRWTPVIKSWMVLSCCDGLTGATLGVAVKRGFDATVAWLCSCLVFGGQQVVALAELRLQRSSQGVSLLPTLEIMASDFDMRPPGYKQHENSTKMFPKPIPEVLETLTVILEQGDETIAKISHEFGYVMGVLLYIQARLSAAPTVELSRKSRHLVHSPDDTFSVGSFLNLHCGHNNPFGREEKERYVELLRQATS